ncbi:MAG TPA: hemagglutinin repeat-containing protein [Azoarcus taiwanensis]|nr:hemagglutinin repeat-containing protein [Azoarcus taiwanensis]
MNKQCYRIVFNALRGQLMAVAEHVSARGKSSRGDRPARARRPGLRVLPTLLLMALGAPFGSVPEAHAQIVAYRDAPGSQRPTVLPGAGGVPIVNVQSPSAAGVSRNTYSQFDVETQGAVLNNSRTGAHTELAGQIQGNPWMARGTARVIVNEVVSGDASQLRGMIEVGGERAEVVIANPAGIDVDGGGFINTSRATLTTGTPRFEGGQLEGYVVQQGTVTVHEGGLNASRTDYAAVIARAVQINGAVHAQELHIIAGANEVSADHENVTPIAGTGPAPAFALDVSELGGMYAGKITLVGTEAGVGVRNAGQIVATAGEVVITAEGLVTNTGQIVSDADTAIDTAEAVTNSGTVYARGAVRVSARERVGNDGLIAAQGNATLSTSDEDGEIDSSQGSMIIAGLDAESFNHPEGELLLMSTGEILVTASASVHIGGYTAAPERIEVSSVFISVRGGSALAPEITLDAVANSRRTRERQAPHGELESDHLVRDTYGTASPSGVQIPAAQGFTTYQAGQIVTDSATLISDRIELNASTLSNRDGQIVQTGSNGLALNLRGTLDNAGGAILTNGDLSIEAARLDNDRGAIRSGTNLAVSVSGHLANGSGAIGGSSGLRLSAGSLSNAGYVGGSVSVAASLNNAGSIAGSATAGGSLNNSGSIAGHAHGSRISNAGSIAGSAFARGSMTNTGTVGGSVHAGAQLANHGAVLGEAIAGTAVLNSGSIMGNAIAGERLDSSGLIAGDATAGTHLDNSGAIVGSAVAGHNLRNSGQVEGTARAGLDLTNAGLIHDQASAGGTLTNSGLVLGDAVSAGELNNSGLIGGDAQAVLELINQGSIFGHAYAGASLSNSGSIGGDAFGRDSLQNSGRIGGNASTIGNLGNSGRIAGHASSAAALANSGTVGGNVVGSSVSNSGAIGGSANASRSLSNAGHIAGSAMAGASLSNSGSIGGSASANSSLSNGGSIGGNASAGGSLGNSGSIAGSASAAQGLSNGGHIGGDASGGSGSLFNAGTVGGNASAHSQLTNSGLIGGSAHTSGQMNNAGAIGTRGGDVGVSASGLVNTGSIGTSGSTHISADILDNRGGTISGQNLSLSARDVMNQNGVVQGSGSVIMLATGTVDNTDGHISATDTLAIIDPTGSANARASTLDIINTDGILSAGSHLGLEAATLGLDGQLHSQGSFSLSLVGDRTLDSLDFFHAEGPVSLAFTGAVQIQTELFHSAGLSIAGGSVHNTETGRIGSDALTAVHSNEGVLLNQGRIDGHTVVLGGIDFDNSAGQVRAGDALFAEFSGNVRNDAGTLASVGDAIISVGAGLTSDRGLFASEQGDLVVHAGGNVSLSATRFEAEHGLAAIVAGGSIKIASQAQNFSREHTSIRELDVRDASSLAFGRDIESHRETERIVATGIEHEASEIVGHNVVLQTGEHLRIEGSHLVANEAMELRAQGGIDIVAAIGHERIEHTQLTETSFGCSDAEGWCGGGVRADREQETVERDTVHASQLEAERIAMAAGGDISILASHLHADHSLFIQADGALTIGALATSEHSLIEWRGGSGLLGLGLMGSGQSVTEAERWHGSTLAAASGDMSLVAGTDFSLEASHLVAGANLFIDANDITLTALTDTVRVDSQQRAGSRRTQSQAVYTELAGGEAPGAVLAGGDILMRAAGDIDVAGMQITSLDGLVGMIAEGDIRIGAVELERAESSLTRSRSSGFLSRTRTTTVNELEQTLHVGSLVSGVRVGLDAGGDLTLAGSAVVADGNIALSAGGNIDIVANTEHTERYYYRDRKKSGIFSSGGLSITIGLQRSTRARNDTFIEQSQATSLVGSRFGSIAVQAGGELNIAGADIVTLGADELTDPEGWAQAREAGLALDETLADNARSITLSGASVSIAPGMDSHLYDESYRFRQSGLTVSITNPAIQAAQTVSQLASAASRAGDDRTRALAGAAGALSLFNAYTTSRNVMDAVENFTNQDALNANAARVGGINISFSLGSSRSRNDSEGEQHTPFASNVLAAGHLAIHAEGAGEASDLTVTASRLSAGGDITLAADHRIVLEAGAERGFEHSTNRSSSSAIGIGVALGGKTTGVSFNASASRSRGHADGEHLGWLNTQVEAGGTLSLASGGDTVVRGAQLAGQRIVADIGGDLLLESLQDTADYNARQRGSGFGVSVCLPPICTGASSLSVSANRARVDGDYLSVVEQTGLYAGDGGFDITVAGHTQLDGAVIASTQAAVEAGVNRLETGTLGFTDLQNHAQANASSRGFTLSSDMLTQGKYGLAKGIVANQLNQGQASGSSYGLSRATVSEGELVIRDETAQLARTGQSAEDTLAELNREALSAHRAATQQDVQALRREAEAVQSIRMAFYNEVSVLTDEAYRIPYLLPEEIYAITRDEAGEITRVQMTLDEMLALDLGENSAQVFTNGIFNDLDAATGYALQISEVPAGQVVYLAYFARANNPISELMVAGFQRFLEGGIANLSNTARAVLAITQQHGADGLDLFGHSRGAMTLGNALEVLARDPAAAGSLSATTLSLFGPAYNASRAAGLLDHLSNGAQPGVLLQNHADDFVGRLIGGNPATHDHRPADSSRLVEWLRMFGETPTVHSCYGAVDPNCDATFGDPVTTVIPPTRN